MGRREVGLAEVKKIQKYSVNSRYWERFTVNTK